MPSLPLTLLALTGATALAAALALTIANGRYEATLPPPPEPPADARADIVPVGDARLHVVSAGPSDAPAVLLMHPAFASLDTFLPSLPTLTARARVVAVDLPGHGRTEAGSSTLADTPAQLSAVLDALGAGRVHVVGVSMGSLVAQHFAETHPNRVASLTVVGGYDIHSPTEELAAAQQGSNLALLGRGLVSPRWMRRTAAGLSTHTPTGEAGFYRASAALRLRRLAPMRGMDDILVARDTARPPYPVRLVTGEHDLELAQRMADEWHARLPGSERIVVPGAGHCVELDDPAAFAALVLAALDGPT